MTEEYEKIIGSIFASRFKIEELIEEDDVGLLFKAEDQFMNTNVMVRIWKEVKVDDKLLGELREYLIKILSIRHQGIMNIEAIGKTSRGDIYYVIPYFSGESFRKKLTTKKLSPIEVVNMIATVCDSLAILHDNGIIHGSLHPGAILIPPASSTESIKTIDLGLNFIVEKLATQIETILTGAVVATTPYRSPEQLNNNPYDHRSDIYSLGAILFEALTGKPPFHNMSSLEILAIHLKGETPKLSDYNKKFQPNSPLQKIIDKALAVKPGKRYPDIRQFGAALKSIPMDYLTELSSTSKVKPAIAQKSKPQKKAYQKPTPPVSLPEPGENRLLKIGVTLLAIGIILGAVFFFMFRPPKEATPEALPQKATKNVKLIKGENRVKQPKRYRKTKPTSIKFDPETIAIMRQAEDALNSGRNREAIRLYKSVLRKDRGNIIAIRNIGIAYANMGNKAMAIKYLRKYLKMNPNPPDYARITTLIKQLKGE